MAHMITDNLNEQASIWCFFSIAQISLMALGVTMIGASKKSTTKGKKE